MSYISHSAVSLDEADYLTILNVTGQNITNVETVKTHEYKNTNELVREFKDNEYKVLISPKDSSLPVNELKEYGISVYEDEPSAMVLTAFSDYLSNKLIRL